MAKTSKLDFKDWIYTTKVPSRMKDFLDKHPVEKKEDRNGNGDDVFKASKIKTYDRHSEHGYNPGEDAKVYEDVEQIDELSKNTLSSYVTKASEDADRKEKISNSKIAVPEYKERSKRKASLRRSGIESAQKKLGENVEQIDELSKKTLGSYIKKAVTPTGTGKSLGGLAAHANRQLKANDKGYKNTMRKAQNRVMGINRATDRLQKEESTELNEGTKEAKTLSSLHKQMKSIRDSHHKQFTKDAHALLTDKGYKKLHDGNYKTTYQKIDSNDNIHHMTINKDGCELSYHNTTSGKKSYHYHDISHDKSHLADGIDKMIHGGYY